MDTSKLDARTETEEYAMITRKRWVVDVDTFYSDGEHNTAISSYHATKAGAMTELRRIIAVHKASRDTLKIVRFDTVNIGIKGKYSNLIISVHAEMMTMPAFAW